MCLLTLYMYVPHPINSVHVHVYTIYNMCSKRRVVKNPLLNFIHPQQSAVGWEYQANLAQHDSQKDASKGFGGKYGVQKESQDEVCSITCSVPHLCLCIVIVNC